jgi:hypothetical protein
MLSTHCAWDQKNILEIVPHHSMFNVRLKYSEKRLITSSPGEIIVGNTIVVFKKQSIFRSFFPSLFATD